MGLAFLSEFVSSLMWEILCSENGGEIGVESTRRNVKSSEGWRSLWGGVNRCRGLGVEWGGRISRVGQLHLHTCPRPPPPPELPAPGKCDGVWMPDSRGALESGGCSSDLLQR